MDLEGELNALRVADAHIRRGLSLIEGQQATVREVERKGGDMGPAMSLLRGMRASLEVMVDHRALIEQAITMIRVGRGR